ncbi:MAG: hypothetical protein IJW48_05495 [Clostridia bacterium]|nr:hypothetical protein [Clostridia bacterium]
MEKRCDESYARFLGWGFIEKSESIIYSDCDASLKRETDTEIEKLEMLEVGQRYAKITDERGYGAVSLKGNGTAAT